jgi:nucleoside diphosphate kinase
MPEDIYTRESAADIAAVAGRSPAPALHEYALMTFKPEAVPGRRLRPGLAFLDAHGFEIAAVAPLRYSRHSMRELWRYDWDRYSIDRLALATVMYTAGEGLLLILRDIRPQDNEPAALRLRALRGSAAVEEREPGSLRATLEPPNEVLNFVHVADTPADVVRELGIFLDRFERRALLRAIVEGDAAAGSSERVAREVLAHVDRLEAGCPEHDLDTIGSLARVVRAVPSAATSEARLRAACEDVAPKLAWEDLVALVWPADERITVWDFIAVACGAIELWR